MVSVVSWSVVFMLSVTLPPIVFKCCMDPVDWLVDGMDSLMVDDCASWSKYVSTPRSWAATTFIALWCFFPFALLVKACLPMLETSSSFLHCEQNALVEFEPLRTHGNWASLNYRTWKWQRPASAKQCGPIHIFASKMTRKITFPI